MNDDNRVTFDEPGKDIPRYTTVSSSTNNQNVFVKMVISVSRGYIVTSRGANIALFIVSIIIFVISIVLFVNSGEESTRPEERTVNSHLEPR